MDDREPRGLDRYARWRRGLTTVLHRAVREGRLLSHRAASVITLARVVSVADSTTGRHVGLVCVYRARNEALVRGLVGQLPAGTSVALWALDEVAPSLAAQTIGCGPGGRLDHLNAAIASLPARPDVLVVTDDDVEFATGDLRRLLDVGAALDFDVFQPAHTHDSVSSFAFVHAEPLWVGRETTFVEQGPVVVLGRRAQSVLLPFPAGFGMGWGVEARWITAAAEHGLRLGIVDTATIRHAQDTRTYDDRPERERMRRELAAIGRTDMRELQHTVRRHGPLAVWRRDQRIDLRDTLDMRAPTAIAEPHGSRAE